MKIEKDTFVGKWYSLSYILTQKLFNNDTWSFDKMVRIPESTNLCFMMRSMFIWSPLYILAVIALIGGYGYALVYLPFTYGGAVGYFNSYGIPVIIVGLIALVIWICCQLWDFWASDLSKEEKKKLKRARHADGNYTVMELIVKWIKAKYRKVCPLVDIIQKGESK